MLKTMLTLLCLLLTGCATQSGRDPLIGLDRQRILGCIEQADSGEAADNWEHLRFTGSKADAMCPLKKLAGMAPSLRHCTVEFSLKEERVASVRYLAADGSEIEDTSRCAFLVEKCIK